MVNIVITGSSKGIGFGLACEFARTGHNVMISGSSDESVQLALKKMPHGLSGRLTGRPCDVTHAAEVQGLWDAAQASFGSVDIWINNAGLARTVWPITETPADQIKQMINTNLLGTALGCKIAASGMLTQGSGKLFNILGGGSDGEYFPGMGIYGSTKRGMDYLTQALVKELEDSPIIVGKIRPGMVITEGVLREIAADPELFEKSRKTMNVLCDHVETVTPYLVEQMLACEKSGSRIAWLNGRKIGTRMLMSRLRKTPDKFERYGL